MFEIETNGGNECDHTRGNGPTDIDHKSLQKNNPAISAVIHQLIVVPLQGEGSPDVTIVEENLNKLEKVLDVYEERLKKTKYLAGDSYTLADLHHVPYIYYFMKTSHAGLVNDRPKVKAWWDDLCSCPAFVKVSLGLTVEPATN